jgi:hypothetical protein
VQRRALAGLFLILALVFAATCVAALDGAGSDAARWLVAFAAGALAVWLAGLARASLRRR